MGIAREVLFFLLVFAAGLLIAVFVGIIYMTKVWEKAAAQLLERRKKLDRKLPVIFGPKRIAGIKSA